MNKIKLVFLVGLSIAATSLFGQVSIFDQIPSGFSSIGNSTNTYLRTDKTLLTVAVKHNRKIVVIYNFQTKKIVETNVTDENFSGMLPLHFTSNDRRYIAYSNGFFYIRLLTAIGNTYDRLVRISEDDGTSTVLFSPSGNNAPYITDMVAYNNGIYYVMYKNGVSQPEGFPKLMRVSNTSSSLEEVILSDKDYLFPDKESIYYADNYLYFVRRKFPSSTYTWFFSRIDTRTNTEVLFSDDLYKKAILESKTGTQFPIGSIKFNLVDILSDLLIFYVVDLNGGTNYYSFNLKTENITLLKSIPFRTGATGSYYWQRHELKNGKIILYDFNFKSDKSSDEVVEIWQTDGTISGTETLAKLDSPQSNPLILPVRGQEKGNIVGDYFIIVGQRKLTKGDFLISINLKTKAVIEINPPDNTYMDSYFFNWGLVDWRTPNSNCFYFEYHTNTAGKNNGAIWKSDGTLSGTKEIITFLGFNRSFFKFSDSELGAFTAQNGDLNPTFNLLKIGCEGGILPTPDLKDLLSSQNGKKWINNKLKINGVETTLEACDLGYSSVYFSDGKFEENFALGCGDYAKASGTFTVSQDEKFIVYNYTTNKSGFNNTSETWTISNLTSSSFTISFRHSDGNLYEYTLVVDNNTTSIVDNSLGNSIFEVFPNPSNGVINVKSKTESKAIILSLEGKELSSHNLKEGLNQLDANLKAGIYILRINNHNAKLVVNQ